MKEQILETVFCPSHHNLQFRAVIIDNVLTYQNSMDSGETWQNAHGTGFLSIFNIVHAGSEIKTTEGIYTGFDVMPIDESNDEVEKMENTANRVRGHINRTDTMIQITELGNLLQVSFLNGLIMEYIGV